MRWIVLIAPLVLTLAVASPSQAWWPHHHCSNCDQGDSHVSWLHRHCWKCGHGHSHGSFDYGSGFDTGIPYGYAYGPPNFRPPQTPPFPPFNGFLTVPQGQQGQQQNYANFPSQPYARSPRDFFMLDF